MKLLPKTKIVSLKADERKKEIEEGAKLAKTIDVLRQTKASEETNLRKFREGSFASIKLEIDALLQERDAIQFQVTSLEEKNAQLKTGLDQESERLLLEKERLTDLDNTLRSQNEGLITASNTLLEDKHAFTLEQERLISLKLETERIAQLASEKERASEKNLAQATKRLETITELMTDSENEIKRKEADIVYRELDVRNAWDAVNKEKDRLTTLEKELTTKISTLDSKDEAKRRESGIIQERLDLETNRETINRLMNDYNSKKLELQNMMTQHEKSIEDKESELIIRESDLEVRSTELKTLERSLNNRDSITQNKLNEANSYYEKAKIILEDTERQKKEINQEIERRLEELTAKEATLHNLELDLEIKKDVIDKEFAKINQDRTHIASQQETLRLAWVNLKKLTK